MRSIAFHIGLAVILVTAATLLGGTSAALGQGACCLPDGGCTPAADESECSAGVFLAGADCADSPCGPGACCFEGSCSTATAFDCITAGREYAGADVSCLDDPCDFGSGACCFTDGSCMEISTEDCTSLGGTWQGPGTTCAQGACDVGACCLPGTCVELQQFVCQAMGGLFVAGDCTGSPCDLQDDCPADSLYGQSRHVPNFATAYTSEDSAGFRRFDNFFDVPGPVEAVRWWGFDLDFVPPDFVECTETDLQFEVAFHADAGGAPGAAVCSYTLLAQRIPTGLDYFGFELLEYRVTLPQPCALVDGWISIVGLGDPECWFLWLSSPEGDGISWCDGCLASLEGDDLSFCLIGTAGGVLGACCNDSTGTCVEGVEIADCTGPGMRFLAEGTCAELDPPCGVLSGACCIGDGTCSIELEEDCAALAGDWLGVFTLCEQCPCVVPCPDGGIPEGEPACGDGYVDTFNGGCTAAAPAFSPIAIGQTICGASGVFDDGDLPDLDWYEVVVTEPLELVWSAQAQFPAQIWIVDGTQGCDGSVLATTSGLECDELSISAAADKGTYWLVISAIAFTDTSMCPAPYTAMLGQVSVPCPGDTNGDGEVNVDDLTAVILDWGTDGSGHGGDVDGSGTVDVDDLTVIILAWGPCGRGSD